MSTQNEFPAVSNGALMAFRAAAPEIIKETVAQAMISVDDVVQHGDQAERLIAAGLEFTTRMLDSAMSVGAISFLEDELLWAKERLPHDGVSLQQVSKRLKIYRQIILKQLTPKEGIEVAGYVDWMISRIETLVPPN